MSAGTVTAAVVAREQARHEEQEMTRYTDKDLAEGWEFKIVRANTPYFRKPEQLQAVLEEERKGGWILVEKFDDTRIRLKRLAGAKVLAGDLADGYDPYRTTVGTLPAWMLLVLVALVFGTWAAVITAGLVARR